MNAPESSATPPPPTAVITGGNAGIGFTTACDLARLGWNVVITGRDPARLAQAAATIGKRNGGGVSWQAADFASFAEVRALAATLAGLSRIDVLINNIGIAVNPQQTSRDGLDLMLQVNHLAPFLLTNLLVPKLTAAPPARIVMVSSRMHGLARDHGFADFRFERRFSTGNAYARTKLYNILFARELARRLAGTGVTANALHPGAIESRIGMDGDLRGLAGLIWRLLRRAMMRPPAEGSKVPVHLATAPELATVTGAYVTPELVPVEPSPLARDDAAAARLWALSAELTGLA
jgi:NAD(P)-dependent dehydrogenase (short-subunit alcohol dehydrogenase family)